MLCFFVSTKNGLVVCLVLETKRTKNIRPQFINQKLDFDLMQC
jgi:hypothetical protein